MVTVRFTLKDDKQTEMLIENNPGLTTQDIAEIPQIAHIKWFQMSCSRKAFENTWMSVNCYDVLVPRDFTEQKLINGISLCDTLHQRNKLNQTINQ